MKLRIDTNIKEFKKNMKRTERHELPYIAYNTVNETAKEIIKKEKKAMHIYLDKPTKQVVNSVFMKKFANRRDFTAIMSFRDWAVSFMSLQIFGGVRRERTLVPTSHTNLNVHGNIPGRRTGVAKGKRFLDTINNIEGVWVHKGSGKNKKLNLYAKMKEFTKYDVIFPWFRVAEINTKRVLKRKFVEVSKKVLGK